MRLHNKSKTNEGYCASYIRKMHQTLNQVSNQAVKWKQIKYNPVIDADPPAVKKEEIKFGHMTKLIRFLTTVREKDTI